jgi:hypothetical protein
MDFALPFAPISSKLQAWIILFNKTLGEKAPMCLLSSSYSGLDRVTNNLGALATKAFEVSIHLYTDGGVVMQGCFGSYCFPNSSGGRPARGMGAGSFGFLCCQSCRVIPGKSALQNVAGISPLLVASGVPCPDPIPGPCPDPPFACPPIG